MFKSIENKSLIAIFLLVISTGAATYFYIHNQIAYSILAGAACVFCFSLLRKHYKKFNKNIIFLLNALENGDYSFWFLESKSSKREREINSVLNHIKFILTKARKEVIENEKFLSLIVENVSTGIVIVDDRGVVHKANQAALKFLGMHIFTHLNQLKMIDKSLPDVFNGIATNQAAQVKLSNEREEIQVSVSLSKMVLKRGEMRIYTLNNIGNELEAKEMESWIKLIRVMTHEIMNSIAPITSLSSTMLYSYQKKAEQEPSDPLTINTIEALETISSTAKGLLTFVQSYRKFTGIPKPERKDFDVIPVINNILKLNAHLLAQKRIEVELVSEKSSLILNADESQVVQVLVNLIKNAIESISPESGGRIAIKVRNEANPQLDVCDNGMPIPADVLPHIFIPFFTTKESGTGIGLSISRYIMRLHGGNLKHYATNGWTIFTMVF